MIPIKLPKQYTKVERESNHHCALKFTFANGEIETVYLHQNKGINYETLFAEANLEKFYKWKILQELFWKDPESPLGKYIKENFKLNDTPNWE